MKRSDVRNPSTCENTGLSAWCRKLAKEDVAIVSRWAAQVHLNANTQASYRKEGLRFLLWLNVTKEKTLSQVTAEDLTMYRYFLAAPAPGSLWIGPPVPTTDELWRPFTKPLSGASIRLALTTLTALFRYTHQEDYGNVWVHINRVTAMRPPPSTAQPSIDFETVRCLADYIEYRLQSAKRERARYECARWALHLAYLAGAHREEMTQAFMRDISRTETGGVWTIRNGRGRSRDVPVSLELILAFARYRAFYGLSVTPAADEQLPLLLGLRSPSNAAKPKRLSYKSLYLLFREVCREAADAHAACNSPFSNTMGSLSLDRLRLASERHRLALGEEPLDISLQFGRTLPDLFIIRYICKHRESPCTQLSLKAGSQLSATHDASGGPQDRGDL